MGPQWKHDCERCVFLGRLGKVDLYYHIDSNPLRYTSYLIRYSSNGPDYQSEVDYGDAVLGRRREFVSGLDERRYRIQTLFRVLEVELENLVEGPGEETMKTEDAKAAALGQAMGAATPSYTITLGQSQLVFLLELVKAEKKRSWDERNEAMYVIAIGVEAKLKGL